MEADMGTIGMPNLVVNKAFGTKLNTQYSHFGSISNVKREATQFQRFPAVLAILAAI